MTDTPELVERVARAIYERVCERTKHHLPEIDRAPWDAQAEKIRIEYRHQARAAVEAMREPNDAMGAAGLLATDDSMMRLTEAEREAIGWADRLAGNPSKWMKPVWRAMIDAAREPRR